MKIRPARRNDLAIMVRMDRKSYGRYGASEKYLVKKFNSFPKGMLVMEDEGNVTGFMVFEILGKDEVPENFCDMKLTEPINGKWMCNIVFTTASNYEDKTSDSRLLLAAEKIAKKLGCSEAYVPLSKDHPFGKNGVFDFYEMNGYRKIGEIKWMPNSNDFVECNFYKKSLLLKDMEFLREFKSKSKMTERDALALGAKVSRALAKRYVK